MSGRQDQIEEDLIHDVVRYLDSSPRKVLRTPEEWSQKVREVLRILEEEEMLDPRSESVGAVCGLIIHHLAPGKEIEGSVVGQTVRLILAEEWVEPEDARDALEDFLRAYKPGARLVSTFENLETVFPPEGVWVARTYEVIASLPGGNFAVLSYREIPERESRLSAEIEAGYEIKDRRQLRAMVRRHYRKKLTAVRAEVRRIKDLEETALKALKLP